MILTTENAIATVAQIIRDEAEKKYKEAKKMIADWLLDKKIKDRKRGMRVISKNTNEMNRCIKNIERFHETIIAYASEIPPDFRLVYGNLEFMFSNKVALNNYVFEIEDAIKGVQYND